LASNPHPPVKSSGPRLRWLDGIKGLAILWIAFFHCFEAYNNKRLPSPLGPHYFARFIEQANPRSTFAFVACIAKAAFDAVAGVGFHAVGVFVVMSGFGLCLSLARAGGPRSGWPGWYRSRLVRLFPMYWAAHLLYLVSPFQSRLEPIDFRFILSFLGDRIIPIYTIFYYLNPAWWYFGLILELYIVFPILFTLMRRLGPGWFLALCAVETIISRYLIIYVFKTSGYYTLGAFFGCRLWEFAFGMVVGTWYWQDRARADAHILSFSGLAAGVVLYAAGLYTYGSGIAYTLTDGLIGTGLFLILAQLAWQSRRLPRWDAMLAYVGVYSYGFYLVHQPYVIFFGSRLRSLSMTEFTVVAIVLIAALAYGASWLERGVNVIADRLLESPRHGADAGNGAQIQAASGR
jgi:peptidoglycan/LPS O-acetylase OafA/YrhL